MVKPKILNETKEDKFKRIASARTQKVLDSLRLLGKCANKSVYSYSDQEIRKIFNAIEEELREQKRLFKGEKKEKQFTL